MPLGGGQPLVLASGSPVEWAGIVVDCSYVYFVEHLSGIVQRVPIGGGPPVTIASGQTSPWALVQSPEALYWSSVPDKGSSNGKVTKLAK